MKLAAPLLVLSAGLIAAGTIVAARPEAAPRERPVVQPLVRTVVAQPQAVRLEVRTQGTVEPRSEIDIVPQVAGRAVEVSEHFVAGGFFDEGDVLVRIDARDYELAVRRADAQVAQARTALAREEAEAEVARREWESLGGAGAPPPLVARGPQLEEARAALDAARAAAEQARLDLERTEIRAPFAGRVRAEDVDAGQFVSSGAPIGRVYAIDVAEIRLPLPLDDLAHVDLPLDDRAATGPEVVLSAAFAGTKHTWTGRIVRTEGEIDPRSRMVHAIAQVQDPYGRRGNGGERVAENDVAVAARPPLAVGLFVHATIAGRPLSGAFVLPRSALRPGGTHVLVVDEEHRLRTRDVEVLRAEKDRVIVGAGLEAGEQVCISPLEVVVEGMHVRVANEDDASTAAVPARDERAGRSATGEAP
jgi:RND family efflux transporter MFP subunit